MDDALLYSRAMAPQIMQWLMENYITKPGCVVSRGDLYDDYRAEWIKRNLPTLTASAFGKIVHRAFPGVGVRRYGKQKQMKYFYIGLAKITDTAEASQELFSSLAERPQIVPPILYIQPFTDTFIPPEEVTPGKVIFPITPAELPQLCWSDPAVANDARAAELSYLYTYFDAIMLRQLHELEFDEIVQSGQQFWQRLPPPLYDFMCQEAVTADLIAYEDAIYRLYEQRMFSGSLFCRFPLWALQRFSRLMRQLPRLTEEVWYDRAPPQLRQAMSRTCSSKNMFLRKTVKLVAMVMLIAQLRRMLERVGVVDEMRLEWAKVNTDPLALLWGDDSEKFQTVITSFTSVLHSEVAVDVEQWAAWVERTSLPSVMSATNNIDSSLPLLHQALTPHEWHLLCGLIEQEICVVDDADENASQSVGRQTLHRLWLFVRQCMGGVGSRFLDRIEERQKQAAVRQRLLDLRQLKRQRDFAESMRMATARDRIWWMVAFYTTMGAVSIGRMAMLKQFSPLPLSVVPYVLVPFLILYQADYAYGTKGERINRMARKIREEEDHWFNEPIELPELLKEPYRKLMDEMNEELRRRGKPPEKDWGK